MFSLTFLTYFFANPVALIHTPSQEKHGHRSTDRRVSATATWIRIIRVKISQSDFQQKPNERDPFSSVFEWIADNFRIPTVEFPVSSRSMN